MFSQDHKCIGCLIHAESNALCREQHCSFSPHWVFSFVVLAGNTADHRCKAFDIRTGKEQNFDESQVTGLLLSLDARYHVGHKHILQSLQLLHKLLFTILQVKKLSQMGWKICRFLLKRDTVFSYKKRMHSKQNTNINPFQWWFIKFACRSLCQTAC